ncbi:MAG: FAD-dependent oxidoreductase [Bacilli bacterium]|nr:FAD-dependent oxidoreductase [Bacilli bacterium]
MFDVVIVGAGPAGLFTAYELITKNKNLKVALIDKGFLSSTRKCIMNKTGKCANCSPCNILSGFGGAGTFSDGKLNFTPKIGKSDLFKYLSISDANRIIDETEQIFNKFKMDSKVYPTNMDEAYELKEKIAKVGADLLIIKQKHLGSDKLPKYIEDFTNYLKEKNITIFENCTVLDVEKENNNSFKVKYQNKKTEKEITAKYVVVAPGRTGAKWVQQLADKYNIPYVSQSIEIGVRVEVRKEILKSICSVIYDPTIFIKTSTYNDQIRTFCTNPEGFVAKENYYGYICVNGHALKDIKSNNSNFAFISKVNLTDPTTNTREYGECIAKIANTLGTGKPIVQTLRDLKNGRRSNMDKIKKGFIEPTLKDCIAGDLALVLPHRIIKNILEGLEVLDKIIPGVNNGETLLYGPEIKFFSNEIITDNNMKLEDLNMYFIGDGSGKSGNIVTAAATGLIAARDIIKRIENE